MKFNELGFNFYSSCGVSIFTIVVMVTGEVVKVVAGCECQVISAIGVGAKASGHGFTPSDGRHFFYFGM